MELLDSGLSKKSILNKDLIFKMLDEIILKVQDVSDEEYTTIEAWILKNEFLAVLNVR